MNPPLDPIAALTAAMRRTRFSVLLLLVVCVGVILMHGFAAEEPPPDRWLTSAAVLLGLGTMVLRGIAASPVIRPRRAVVLLLGSLALAAALGLLGVFVAWALDASRTGLLFTLAGTIFTLRPTRPVGPGH